MDRSDPSPVEAPPTWGLGEVVLDTYEVREVFAGGGMGLVYRVHHRGWGLDLAAKVPRAERFATEAQREAFVREAETWVDLGLHPHVATCHYVRSVDGVPVVFAEYVAGGSLDDWITDGRLYEGNDEDTVLARVLGVAIQFAWGLAYAHERGLVHQDVKPANVLIDVDDGEGGVIAKVTDFGLAVAEPIEVGSEAHETMVVAGVGGTPAYMSPEQGQAVASAAGSEGLTRRTDVWSWALSVLDMFTGEGEPKRYGQAAPWVLDQYREAGPGREDVPPMPDGVAGLLRDCFQADPDDRPHDFNQIAARLIDIYREVSGGPYLREKPDAAELLADQLNNKALSLIDLGREDEAEALFEEALETDPHHVEATYNRGLRQWRRGEVTDLDLIAQLEEMRRSHQQTWRDEYLLALVHIERGDAETARELLETSRHQGLDSVEVSSALAIVESEEDAWCKLLRTLKGHTGRAFGVAVSPDGRWVVSGSGDGTVRVWDVGRGSVCRPWRATEWP